MKVIKVINICGNEVLSRSNIRRLYEIIDESTKIINWSGINFISRSVADELCEILNKFPALEFEGMSEDVNTMFTLVQRGRSVKRNHTTRAKISVTYNCRTMEDLRDALSSFGS